MNDGSILLVDDVPRNTALFVSALRMYGFDNEVVIAHDGEEALDFLFGEGRYAGRDIGVAPCLVLLDLHMPRMDGLETLSCIREDERTRRLPVVMFSATAYSEDVTAAYRLGANAFIDKMSADTPYPEMVKQTAHFWLNVNQPPPQVASVMAGV